VDWKRNVEKYVIICIVHCKL